MLNEQLLEKIFNLIEQHGGSEKTELLGTFQDLKTALAGQALLINNQAAELRNHQVNDQVLNMILTQRTLSDLLQSLGVPKQNPFSVAEVASATQELANKVAESNDFSKTIGKIINVAKIFI